MRGINKDWGEVNRPLIIKQLSPYLEKVSRRGSEETAAVYLTAFTALCKTTKELPDKIIHELQSRNRDVYLLLDDFVKVMVRDVEASPETVCTYVAGIKRILRFAGVQVINETFQDMVAMPRTPVRFLDRIPTDEELQRMFGVTDLRGRAMLAILASSGMRIGELLALRVGDIEFGHPTRVLLRAETTKNKWERVAFISDEATALLKDYLGDRANSPDSFVLLGINDPGRQMTYEGARSVFVKILKGAGLVKKEKNRMTIHVHSLRKYFFSRMLPIVNRDVAEALMGHEEYLDSSYRRWTVEQMAEFYLKGMKSVTVMKPLAEVSKEDVEIEATLKALEMMVWNSKDVLARCKPSDGKELMTGQKIAILQEERNKQVEEERSRRFAERLEYQLRLLWYEQGTDGMSDHEVRQMATKFGVGDYEIALRDRGVVYYRDEDRWRYLLLESKPRINQTKQFESQYVKKRSKEEIRSLVEQGYRIEHEVGEEFLLTRQLGS